jgi:branched-chain amino acid transport system substrate-binding protein
MQRTRTGRRAVLTVAALALVVTSCGGGRSDSNSSSNNNSNGNTEGTSGSGDGTTFAVNTSDCPDNETAGISGDTITLASSFPQSGITAAFSQISKGYKAYFAKVNDAGGVEVAGKKYKIEVKDKDDEYNASKTVTNINELAGSDGSKAFAVFNVVGTANNIAIRQSLGDNCVPNLFAATGSPAWGNSSYPWLVGSTLAPYTIEANAFAEHLKKTQPKAKVAMLVQNDDFGKAYEEGFKQAVKETDISVVKVATYEGGGNDVAAQVTSLAASGADVFFNGATLLACPNALTEATKNNWKRTETFVSGTCISKTLMGIAGTNADKVFAVTNTMDPMNPAYADDADMKQYRADLTKYAAKDVDADNGIVAYGYTQAAVFVHVLENSPKLTRSAVLDTLRNIDTNEHIGLLVPGVSLKMNKDDPFLAENVQLVQYDAAESHFNNVGDLLEYEGKTASITPKDLIES